MLRGSHRLALLGRRGDAWTFRSLLLLLLGFALQACDGDRMRGLWRSLAAWPAWLLGAAAAAVLTLILSLGPEGVAPFIYFQF